MLWLNGEPLQASRWNRGLAFGDGAFETVSFRAGQAALWPWHSSRLQNACRVLELQYPDPGQLLADCQRLLPQPDGVMRITLVRTDAAAGVTAYGSLAGDSPVDIYLRYRPSPKAHPQALRTAWSSLRLARQPALSGIKHLNRLEQVLAARQAARLDVDELLLRDTKGHVIEAISSNLLVNDGERWLTPVLHDSGVAGVMRQWLLEQELVSEISMQPNDIQQAQALALCNSARGVQAIAEHAGQSFSNARLDELRQATRSLGL